MTLFWTKPHGRTGVGVPNENNNACKSRNIAVFHYLIENENSTQRRSIVTNTPVAEDRNWGVDESDYSL